jgi:hypothetical protein
LTSKNVAKKARRKALEAEKKSPIWFEDLFIRARESIKYETYFIPYFALSPLSLLISPPEAHYIVKEEGKRFRQGQIPPVRAMYDATAGIIRKPMKDGKSLLHHNLVINVKTDPSARYGNPVNVMEFITDCSNAHNMGFSLSHFRTQHSKVSKVLPFASVTLDKCWAGITAVNKGLNDVSNEQYFEAAFKAMNDSSQKQSFFKKYIAVLLCSSHVSAIWLRDLLKLYNKDKISKDEFHRLCSLIGLLYGVESLKELDKFSECLFVILTHKNYDEDVE